MGKGPPEAMDTDKRRGSSTPWLLISSAVVLGAVAISTLWMQGPVRWITLFILLVDLVLVYAATYPGSRQDQRNDDRDDDGRRRG